MDVEISPGTVTERNHMQHSNYVDTTNEPKLGDIEEVQKKLLLLKSQLKENRIKDPNGAMQNKISEIEGIYHQIKSQMKQSTADGGQAFTDIKKGFLKAWDELKQAAEKAQTRFD